MDWLEKIIITTICICFVACIIFYICLARYGEFRLTLTEDKELAVVYTIDMYPILEEIRRKD